MRIGINASFARKPNTGIGQVTLNFLKKLSETTNHEPQTTNLEYVLYLEEPLPKDFILPSNFSTRVFLPLWKRDDLIRRIWWEKFSLPRRIKKDKCDLFFSVYQSATILPKNIQHVMLVHDIIPKLFPEYLNNGRKKTYWSLIEKAIHKVDHILSVSTRTEKDLIQHLNVASGKISVAHIDVDEIYKKEVSNNTNRKVLSKYALDPGYILAGGGMEIRKNVDGVIRAYKSLLESNKVLHFVHELPKLVIYGKLLPQLAPLTVDAEKMIKELDLTQHVKLLDMTPQADMPSLFGNALFFVYPSRYEGFGVPPLESMSQGTPAIVSKISSLPEVCRDAALYCDPSDPKDIAMVMKNVLTNRVLRETLTRRGRERAAEFSWDKFVAKFLHVSQAIK